MKGVVFCDVSYFNPPLDLTYQHPWVSIRACDGTFRDPKFAGNLAVAKQLAAAGRVEGYTVYAVYRPGVDIVSVVKDMVGRPDRYVTVMLDVESWGGQISGDHSSEIRETARLFAAWLGDHRRVLAYGNQGDLGSLFPRRPDWLKLVVAAYSSVQPTVPNMVAWQYSDGTARWPRPRLGVRRAPRESKPFGSCDHNIFPGVTREQLPALLGVGDSTEDDMPLNAADKAWIQQTIQSEVQSALNANFSRTRVMVRNALATLKTGTPHGWFGRKNSGGFADGKGL